MANFHYSRAKSDDKQRQAQQASTTPEIAHQSAAQVSQNIAGMGQGRFSPAAGKFMGAEPARRIDPLSPEGQAILARLQR